MRLDVGWHHKVTPRQSGSEWSCLRNVSVLYFLSPAAPELLDPPKSLSHGKQTVTISTRRGRKEAGRVSIVTSPSPESVVEVKSLSFHHYGSPVVFHVQVAPVLGDKGGNWCAKSKILTLEFTSTSTERKDPQWNKNLSEDSYFGVQGMRDEGYRRCWDVV